MCVALVFCQIAGLRWQGDETRPPLAEEGAWPSESSELVKMVEREVEEVRVEWEESREAVCRHQTIITEMTVRLVSPHHYMYMHVHVHVYRISENVGL